MNKKLKIVLQRGSSEQGFAIPIAVGLGLVMLLIAATMIVRSQGDQVTASAQKATAQSLAGAEGGISRTLAKLNQSDPTSNYSALLNLNHDPINSSTGKTYLGPDGIANNGDEESVAVDEWTEANKPPCTTLSDITSSGTIGNSTYEVLAYRYVAATKQGTLLVKGQVSNNTSSESRVQQIFNVGPKQSTFIGVLGTNDINLGNNDVKGIYGNVACTNTTNCPVTCPYTQAAAKTAIGGLGSAEVDGKIFIGSLTIPALPTMPTVWSGTGTAPTTAFTTALPDYTSNNQTLIFPRPSDFAKHVAGTPYHYKINTMDANGFKITINTQQNTTTNPTGDPVYFWVSGSIRMGGSSQLIHTASATNPTAFRIYGTSTTSQDFLVASGSSDVDAFIFAPNARVGINGTGTIDGIVYAKSFGEIGANGNAIVRVPTNSNLVSSLGDLAVYSSYQTDSVNSWQRQAAP